ncbi:MAG: hypothetical protein K0R50_1797, partial [Eubacterium sp.]|nr:hypothetical protein [Eubacterium sp.]
SGEFALREACCTLSIEGMFDKIIS